MFKRISRWLIAGVAALMCAALVPAAADAKPRDGKCDNGEFCYYFNSDRKGAVSDFDASLGQYGDKQPGCYEFRGGGNGNGKCIKNAAAYVWNRTNKQATVFYNSNFSGPTQIYSPGASGNLRPGIKNQNASHRLDTPPPPQSPPPVSCGGVCSADQEPKPSGQPAPGPLWVSPVPAGQRVSARWFYKTRNRGGYHGAYDIPGDYMVKSACSGYVSNVDIKKGRITRFVNGKKTRPELRNSNANGRSKSTNYLWIRCDGDPVQMGYAHFYAKDKPGWIKPKARVKAGQILFRTGNQGNSSGQHLHFQITRGAKDSNPDAEKNMNVNPLEFMRGKGVKDFPA